MVNTTLLDPNRVRTYAVGFDRMFDRLFDESLHTTTNYPPYNIVKYGDNKYCIEIAVAGFSKDDIEIETKENVLTVRSNEHFVHERKTEEEQGVEYLHKGISARQFKRSFTLSNDVIVNDASLEDGLLKVELERVVPEEKKPRLIEIK